MEKKRIKIFISYSRKDQYYRDLLTSSLSVIKRRKNISIWDDTMLLPGEDVDERILTELREADIIIPLISADFIASHYAYSIELSEAIKRAQKGEARLVPIIIRTCMWRETELSQFQVLPSDGVSIAQQRDIDEALFQIAEKLMFVIEDLESQRDLIIGDKNIILTNVTSNNINISIRFTTYDVNDVFPLSGLPELTFVEPVSFKRLLSSIKHKGRGLVIEGASGIGKTTALKKAIEKLNIEQSEFKYLSARNPEHLQEINNLRRNHSGIVAIDDFHRLNEDKKKEISDYLKYLADTETTMKKLIIIGIPNTGDKLINFGYDLAGRIDVFELTKVPNEKINDLIGKGEKLLNVKFAKKSEYISASNGSLNIAQFLCHYSVINQDIYETSKDAILIDTDFIDIIDNVKQVLRPKFEDFIFSFSRLDGIRDRTCIKLLHEIALSVNGSVLLNRLEDTRPSLTNGIRNLRENDLVKKLMAEKSGCKSFIYFDKTSTELVIDDPQLIFYLCYTSESQLAKLAGKKERINRSKVFLSYSHKDKKYLERLLVHLKPLIRENQIDVWSDTKIRPGEKWNREIQQALESAKIAVLLISADFIASDYIREKELPVLIKSNFDDGAIIIPLFLKPARLSNFDHITQYQGINTPDIPLIDMNESEKERTFANLAEEIEKYYKEEIHEAQ